MKKFGTLLSPNMLIIEKNNAIILAIRFPKIGINDSKNPHANVI